MGSYLPTGGCPATFKAVERLLSYFKGSLLKDHCRWAPAHPGRLSQAGTVKRMPLKEK